MPVRSASLALIACLNVIVTASLETGAVQADLLKRTCSGCGQRERPVDQVARGRSRVSAASPAVVTTLAVVVAVYSFATPGVNAPNVAAGPIVSASVAGTVPPTSPNAAPVAAAKAASAAHDRQRHVAVRRVDRQLRAGRGPQRVLVVARQDHEREPATRPG